MVFYSIHLLDVIWHLISIFIIIIIVFVVVVRDISNFRKVREFVILG